MSPYDELADLESMLDRLRTLRAQREWGEVRQAYNAALDRLDVLCSKVYEEQRRPPRVRFRGFWSRVWGR